MSTHLVVRDLTVSFNGFMAVNGLDLTINRGELRCLIGPNGAGKTTCLDLICGKVKPTAGSIVFDGKHLESLEEYMIARSGVGRKFQVPSVFRELTVRQNLEVAHCKRPGVWTNLMRGPQNDAAAGLEDLCVFVDLIDQIEAPAAYLSHGQTQWLEIALLMAQNAELILMDEPTAGMTVQETRKTAEIFNRLKGRHTLIVVEHDMGFVKEIGDSISVMHQGKLLAEGNVSDIESNPLVREAYLGSGASVMLEIKNLSAFYGNSRALQNVTLEVGEAGFLSVLGRNGVGKTTLLRSIVGLMDRNDGSIRLDGEEIAATPTHDRVRHGIGYVPQGRGILPQFTVRENLKLGTFARRNPGDAGVLEDKVFDLFPVLKEFLNRRGGNLSGGQQQQLAIARAMLTNPKIVLLDEPTEGIQPNLVEQIEDVIVRLNKEHGITIILVEQDVNFARRASRSFVIIEKGHVAASGPIDTLTDDLVHRHMAV